MKNSTQPVLDILDKINRVTRFEKLCLLFIKSKITYDTITGFTIVYKIFRKKTFIVRSFIAPPNHFNCRCDIGYNH